MCAWIRETRETLKERARAEGGSDAASEYSQEAVARRVGVSLKAYRAYETFREPNYDRRRSIASNGFGLDPDYFENSRSAEERLRQIVQEEVSGLRDDVERLERLLRQRAAGSRSRRETS